MEFPIGLSLLSHTIYTNIVWLHTTFAGRQNELFATECLHNITAAILVGMAQTVPKHPCGKPQDNHDNILQNHARRVVNDQSHSPFLYLNIGHPDSIRIIRPKYVDERPTRNPSFLQAQRVCP